MPKHKKAKSEWFLLSLFWGFVLFVIGLLFLGMGCKTSTVTSPRVTQTNVMLAPVPPFLYPPVSVAAPVNGVTSRTASDVVVVPWNTISLAFTIVYSPLAKSNVLQSRAINTSVWTNHMFFSTNYFGDLIINVPIDKNIIGKEFRVGIIQ